MTVKEVFEAYLIEANKKGRPSLLLEDYNYFINKAIRNYVNKRYALFSSSQQVADDLQVLTGHVVFSINNYSQSSSEINYTASGTIPNYSGSSIFNPRRGQMFFQLPSNYYHTLTTTVTFEVIQRYKNYNQGDLVDFGATRTTSVTKSATINDYFSRPWYKRPYYDVSDIKDPLSNNKDAYVPESDITSTNHFNDIVYTQPALEILVGNTFPSMRVKEILVNYLRVPKVIRLTEEQVMATNDTSQKMEFPDYVVQEIINELTILVMENMEDNRSTNFQAVNKTITDNPEEPQSVVR